MKRRRGWPPEPPEETNFWVSYSDLLAGLLLVFVLLLVVAMFHYAEFIREKQDRLELQKARLTAFHELEKELISSLAGALTEELAIVDPTTGVLQIESQILFGEGEAALRPEGRARLQKIFDQYIKVVLSEEFAPFIKYIEIEGHTNSRGSYLHNLELSQRRALAVMKALLAGAGTQRDRLQEKVVASGHSFSRLIFDAEGREDHVRSRRIEIKFRLKEAEMLRDIYRDLSASP